jgi:phosphate transport system substrate-binding protein
MRRLLALAVFAVNLSAASALGQTLINGAGASFPYPLYSKWTAEYSAIDPAVHFNYQSIGSGGGIAQIIAKTIDFGASDAPMSNEELAKAPAPLLHIPTTMGAVVITYNLPGKPALKLTPEVIAGIFLGKIASWNDAAITAINPGVSLPSTPIAVVHRSDGSGTTYVFTDYLSKISPEWAKDVHTGKAVHWPTGTGAKGNEGVTGQVTQLPGAIGYVELAYAFQNKLPVATLRNKAGDWVSPSVASVTAAASAASKAMPGDLRVSITDADGAGSWPISAFTYLLIYKEQTDPSKGPVLIKFLRWAIHQGQKYCEPLQYAPLPASVVKLDDAKLDSVTLNGQKI